jgi:excisionase family DNA binding protein
MGGIAATGTVLMRPAEVAAVFGVTTRTVGRWGRRGVLRVVRTPGGHTRFYAEDVRALALQATTPAMVE